MTSLRQVLWCWPNASSKSTLLTFPFRKFSHSFAYSVSHITQKPGQKEETPDPKGGSHVYKLSGMWARTTFRPVVISGPSGSGKSTLLKMLVTEFHDCFAYSVSHTTRKPRPREEEGKDYHFVSREEMQKAIESGEFIEHANFAGNLYGTSKRAVQNIVASGKICILDIDEQGVKMVKRSELNARYIFVRRPTLEVLEEVLRSRGTESAENIRKRMLAAESALRYANQKGAYDHVIVNHFKEDSYDTLKSLLIHDIEALRRSR